MILSVSSLSWHMIVVKSLQKNIILAWVNTAVAMPAGYVYFIPWLAIQILFRKEKAHPSNSFIFFLHSTLFPFLTLPMHHMAAFHKPMRKMLVQ